MLFWVRVVNKKELKKYRKQGVVLVSNHLSNMDIPLMFHGMPREIFFLAKPQLFRKRLHAWFFRGLNGYPIEQGKDLALMKHSIGVLRKKKALMIFPEGMRVFNPEDALALKNGASLIAIKGNVPIIPMVINRPLKAFRLTKIMVGEAISTEEFQGRKVDKDELTAFSNKVSDVMADMLATPNFQVKEKKKWWDKINVDVARAICFKEEEDGTKILLMKRNKPSYRGGADYFVTPGGHLDEGETDKQGVIREVMEETGIDVKPVRVVYKHQAPDRYNRIGRDKMLSYFVCEYKGGEITMNPESEEYSEAVKSEVDAQGNLVGTFEPMWIPIERIFEKKFDMKPEQIHVQLKKDFKKMGTRIVKRTQYFK